MGERHEGNEKEGHEKERRRQGQTGEVFGVSRHERENNERSEEIRFDPEQIGQGGVEETICPRKENLSEEWVGQMDQSRCCGAEIDGHQGMAECGWKVRQRSGAVEKSPVSLPQINIFFEFIGFKLGSSGVCPL